MSRSFGLPDNVRDYVQRFGAREHPALARCREETHRDLGSRAGMQISPEQGALMQVLAHAIRARRAVEVGVFTGYSSTAVALAMQAMHGPDALLVACDISDEFVARARSYWAQAGVERVIAPRIGAADQSLRDLVEEGLSNSFDLAFIDADKTGYDAYYELCLTLLRPGGMILIDNMLWSGKVADPADTDPDTRALRALAAKIHADGRVEMTLAGVGDGLSVVVKR
ncbi:MAG TPA: class I SAM-dependent methyltransferase [Caulobacteraceae bacterium]|jgi:caffeoyl-CoA O-methyltransferase|nr:class I SAM-dependent methyltransferase [Caulobacteraceae bacterium]